MIVAQINLEVFHVNEDLSHSDEEISYKQTDFDLKQIAVNLKCDGQDFVIPENATVMWNCERPDGQTASFSVEVVDEPLGSEATQTLYCTLGSWHTEYIGTLYSEICIITDTGKLTSQTFSVYIPKAIITDSTVESDVNYPILVKLIKDVNDLITDINGRLERGEFNGESVEITSIEQTDIAGAVSKVVFSDGKSLSVRNGYNGTDGKSPYINPTNKNWMVWDSDTQQFIDSGIVAQGSGVGAVRYDLPQELTENEKKQARDNMDAISLNEAEPVALTNMEIENLLNSITM